MFTVQKAALTTINARKMGVIIHLLAKLPKHLIFELQDFGSLIIRRKNVS